MSGPGFAVIDFETTGLFPGGHDRIIEVAVVHADPSGRVTGAWETLVNPGRDLGRQDIHRIRAADIMSAPTFEEIAPRLVELLSGRVIVAHNASFDTRFLLAELKRISYEPPPALRAMCTMQLAQELLPGAGRSLADCCAAFDIEISEAHRAAADALATAHLLEAYIASTSDSAFWDTALDTAVEAGWPPLTVVDAEWVAREAAASAERADPARFLERISVRLPDYTGPAEHRDYLALLDRCLLDRRLSVHEADQLVQVAEELGLGRDTCELLHRRYFDDLARLAWADGVLTADETAQLAAVGTLLRIPSDAVVAAMNPLPDTDPVAPLPSHFSLDQGDLVVLTGDMQRPRQHWHDELVSRGYTPWAAVTKKVKLVVAADPDSLSGKARKARDYGIAIVDERGLSSLLAR
jgi:DNA polymerase-3 subunit epsilon